MLAGMLETQPDIFARSVRGFAGRGSRLRASQPCARAGTRFVSGSARLPPGLMRISALKRGVLLAVAMRRLWGAKSEKTRKRIA